MAGIYELTDTWNSGGTTFSAVKMNVTDSASASGSKLIDLQVGAVEQFAVTKAGAVRAKGDLAINTDKFTVAGADGDTVIAGTLDVAGDVAVATDKFTVAAANGDTVIAGSLSVADEIVIDAGESEEGPVTITGEVLSAGTDAGAAGHTDGAVATHVLVINVGGTPYYVPLCAINTTT